MKINDEDLEVFVERIITDYHGDSHSLYCAIGALVCGKFLGWRVLRITIASPTYLKYQKILGVDFKKMFPEETKHSRKSWGLTIVKELNNFWDVVKGLASIDSEKKKTLIL